jgi:hypothetical protein
MVLYEKNRTGKTTVMNTQYSTAKFVKTICIKARQVDKNITE